MFCNSNVACKGVICMGFSDSESMKLNKTYLIAYFMKYIYKRGTDSDFMKLNSSRCGTQRLIYRIRSFIVATSCFAT